AEFEAYVNLGDPLGEFYSISNCFTQQTDVIVDVPCVLGLSTTENPDYPTVPGAEKYLPACDDTCKFMPPQTVPPDPDNWNTTGLPFAYDIVSTDWYWDPEVNSGAWVDGGDNNQRFMVTTAVENCTNVPKDLEICLMGMDGWVVDTTEPVHVYCEGAGFEEWITPGTSCVNVIGLCNCCEVLVTWILECTGPSDFESSTAPYDEIWVEVREINPSNGTWISYDFNASPRPQGDPGCHPAGIIQVPKAHLTSDLTAYVDDCTGCPVKVDTVAESQTSTS
ncbi:unnamed protein product, partial [marine sediment metagenome]